MFEQIIQLANYNKITWAQLSRPVALIQTAKISGQYPQMRFMGMNHSSKIRDGKRESNKSGDQK